MNPAEPGTKLGNHPAVRAYSVGCLAALLLILLALSQHGVNRGSLLPILIGILGVARRWRTAPLLVIGAVVFEYLDLWRRMTAWLYAYWTLQPGHWRIWRPPATDWLTDGMLIIGVLVYVIAQYRLQGLTVHIVAPDPRRLSATGRRWRGPRAVSAVLRSPQLVSTSEIVRLLVSAVVFLGVAQLVWSCLPEHWRELGLPPHVWRTIVLAWGIGVGLIVVGSVVGHVSRARMSGAEALLLLQDALWRETRREQRRNHRWLAWARVRRQRREEST